MRRSVMLVSLLALSAIAALDPAAGGALAAVPLVPHLRDVADHETRYAPPVPPGDLNVAYAATGNNDGGRLLTIDLATGAGTLVGDITGVSAVSALAIRSDGQLFGAGAGGAIYLIDAATGAPTLVGDPGIGSIPGLAFDRNDVLYALDFSDLYTIDPATAVATPVGPVLFTTSGLAVDPTDGTLFASSVTGEIYTLDPTNGNATLIGATGVDRLTDLVFDGAGDLYGTFGGGVLPSNELHAIDKTTAAATLVGGIGFTSVSGVTLLSCPPDIDVQPGLLSFELEVGGVDGGELTILNTADAGCGAVSWTVLEEGGDCPWLDVTPSSGVTVPGASAPVGVAIDGCLAPGDYSCVLSIESNDPDESAVAVMVELTVLVPADDIVVDGAADAAYPAPVSVQAIGTRFGDSNLGLVDFANGSELDQAFARVTATTLYLTVAGNLESNFNKLELFLDTRSGGQNRLRGDNPDVDFDGLNRMGDDGGGNGLIFDAGFEADYYITVSGGDPGGGVYQLFASWAELLTGGGGAGRFLGQTGAASDGELTGGDNPAGIRITIDNSNTAGVTAGTGPDSGGGVLTGVELAIPLCAIGGPVDCSEIRVCAFVNGSGHDSVSNQVLGSLPVGTDNLGEPRSVSFATIAGDQWFAACPVAPVIATSPPAFVFVVPAGGVTAGEMSIANHALPGAPDLGWTVSDSVPGGGDCAWLTADPQTGSTAPGDSARIDVGIDPTGLGPGMYACDLVVDSNDPATPSVTIPVTLEVTPYIAPATIDVMYASTGGVDGGRILRIDPVTGVGTLVGDTAIPRVPGLAVSSHGELYGIDDEGNLYRIDAVSGAGVLVGGPAAPASMTAIAFSPSGVLYAASNVAGCGLYTVDTATGTPTLVGSTPDCFAGLAFDPLTGQLYASVSGATGGGVNPDAIYLVDPGTGGASFVGNTTLGGGTPDIAFDASGNLYGLKGGGASAGNDLIAIDTATGVGSVIGSIGFTSVSGLTLLPANLAVGAPETMPPSAAPAFALMRAAPDPFARTTRIAFSVPRDGRVRLEVFNALGQRVATLVDGIMTAGSHLVSFEAGGLASGVYYYRMRSDDFRAVERITLVR